MVTRPIVSPPVQYISYIMLLVYISTRREKKQRLVKVSQLFLSETVGTGLLLKYNVSHSLNPLKRDHHLTAVE